MAIFDVFEGLVAGVRFSLRAPATPRAARREQKEQAKSPSSTVHGGQHDTEYVTFE